MLPRVIPVRSNWPAHLVRSHFSASRRLVRVSVARGEHDLHLDESGSARPDRARLDARFLISTLSFTVAIRSLVSPIVTAVYPHVSQVAHRSGKEGALFLRRYAILLTLPFLVVSVGLFIGSPMLAKIVFGPKYAYTAVLLRIMSPGPFLFALSHCYSTYFMLAFGYQKQWSRLILATAIANFALLGPFLLLMPAPAAFAYTGIALDAFALAMSYSFYRRHVHQHEQSTEPAPALPQALGDAVENARARHFPG